MAKAKFDIGDFAKSVSEKVFESNTSTNIATIDLDDLLEHEGNFYGIRDLDALISSIELDGLQQPIVVTPAEDGKYRVISGHRRRAAIAQLVADGKEKFRKVPCIIRTYQSEEMMELQLILANSTTRVLNNAEIAKQAERVQMLLYQLKEQGVEFPGRMRDQVAAACNVSATKLAKLKIITEKLTGAWVMLFEANRLPEQTAYALARMTPELQERIFKVAGDGVNASSMEKILDLSQTATWLPNMSCPDGTACRRGDTFLKHDIECPYEPCLGETCCLNCPKTKYDYYTCDRMCSKAKAKRKGKKAESDAKEQTRKEKLSDGYKFATMQNAQRLVPLLDAAGVSDETVIKWKCYGPGLPAGSIRKYAEGEFPDELWREADLEPKYCSNLIEVAEQLRCSTDYILGITDNPTQYPVEKSVESGDKPYWRTGKPEQSGDIVGLFDMDGEHHRLLVYYDAVLEQASFVKYGEKISGMELVKWLPLPEEE